MNKTNHHEIIQRYFEAWSTGNIELFDELLATEYINHTPSLPDHPGVDGLKYIVSAIRKGFPDLHYEILRISAEGDLVAVQTLMIGTNTGELFGAAPTGNKIRVSQMQFERIENGKIIEHWRITDEALIQRQLAGESKA